MKIHKLTTCLEILEKLNIDILQICILATKNRLSYDYLSLLDKEFTINNFYEAGWPNYNIPLVGQFSLLEIDEYQSLDLYIFSNQPIGILLDKFFLNPYSHYKVGHNPKYEINLIRLNLLNV